MNITMPAPRRVQITLDDLSDTQIDEIKELIRLWVEKNDLASACDKLTEAPPDESKDKIYL